MTPYEIDVVLNHPRYLPTRAKKGDAGADLKARIEGTGSVTLNPNEQKLIMTGVKIAIPMGWTGLITPRSGMALKQRVRIGNSPGVIDAGYRDEIGVIIHNDSDDLLKIDDGDRIAQLLIMPCVICGFDPVTSLPESERGIGGFGSTGV